MLLYIKANIWMNIFFVKVFISACLFYYALFLMLVQYFKFVFYIIAKVLRLSLLNFAFISDRQKGNSR